MECWGSNTLIPLYDLDNTVCGIHFNGIAYYFYKNLQGDVIAITDDTGATVAKYRYDAWGKCTIVSDTTNIKIATVNPFRYRSYYYDHETGWYYLQSRYYDPNIGRFINADETLLVLKTDSIIESNLYSYCENNAVNSVDVFGYKSFTIPSFIVGTIIDIILLAIPYFGISFAPIKAAAKASGKFAAKKLASKLPKFLATIFKYANKILSFFVNVVKKIPLLGKKIAKSLTPYDLFGNLFSISVNALINKIMPYFYMLLSVGGFFQGVFDYFSDDKMNGKIVINF